MPLHSELIPPVKKDQWRRLGIAQSMLNSLGSGEVLFQYDEYVLPDVNLYLISLRNENIAMKRSTIRDKVRALYLFSSEVITKNVREFNRCTFSGFS